MSLLKLSVAPKLNGATDNLSRLMDIEQTYQEQLVELEKQARKAVRYKSVGERLRKAESTLFIKLLNSLEIELKSFKKEYEEASDNVNQAQLDVTKNTKSKLVAFDKIPELKQIEAEKAATLQQMAHIKLAAALPEGEVKEKLLEKLAAAALSKYA